MGRGVFASTFIPSGIFLGLYEGEKISEFVSQERCKKGEGLYIFELEKGIYIDGRIGGNWTSIINHSRDPNVQAFSNSKQETIEIVSCRAIRKGEQLFLNYGEHWFEENNVKEL